MHLATTTRAALLLAPLLAGCFGKDMAWPLPDDSAADDTAAQDDSGETGETGDGRDPFDPCAYVECGETGSSSVQLEQPFVGPYLWVCDAAQGGATYTVALQVEITPEDAASALLETVYDMAYAEAASLPPMMITTGVPQDDEGRPLLTCTWDAELSLYREERLTLRGG